MALTIAVPLSGVADMLGENFNLMSPISLQSPAAVSSSNFDCRSTTKLLCSPIDSESSGISSLDSEEIKKSSVSSSPSDDEHHSSDQGSNTPSLSDLSSEQKNHLLSPKPKHAIAATANTTDKIDTSKVEKTEDHKQSPKNDEIFDEDKGSLAMAVLTNLYRIEEEKQPNYDLRIRTNGRNILDLGANLRGKSLNATNNVWQQQGFIRYAHLPENNLKMFLENRSQYHRLGANGNLQEYALVDCKCCDFTYPVNGDTTKSSTMGNNIIKSIKTNINGVKNDLAVNGVNENPSTFARPSTQNQYFSVDKSQCHEPNTINFDNSASNNILTALNRNATNFSNPSNNNILENVAAALLNTTNNNVSSSNNYGLNQKHFNNNTHHHFNNQQQQQQQHAFAGNYHYGTKNYYTSHSHSYKQF